MVLSGAFESKFEKDHKISNTGWHEITVLY